MTLSVAVMAHRKRQAFVDELLPQVPGAEVVWDERGDRWDTGRRALLAHDHAADFHCVIQDDAILCKDFLAGAELAARAAGARPVGLYTGKVRPHAHHVTPAVLKALRGGHPWIHGCGPLWGVAIVVPTVHIAELVAWCDGQRHIANYDRRIEAFYREKRVDCWYTIPSLVDHRHVDENPSLIPGRGDNRQAHIFLGARSPVDIDWSLPPILIHGLTAETVAQNESTQRSEYMALRRYTLVQEDGSEAVKLIDEAHVAKFRKAAGVVSVEPIDDESFVPEPIQYGDGVPGEDLDEDQVDADPDSEGDDDDSDEDADSEDESERDDDGEALA